MYFYDSNYNRDLNVWRCFGNNHFNMGHDTRFLTCIVLTLSLNIYKVLIAHLDTAYIDKYDSDGLYAFTVMSWVCPVLNMSHSAFQPQAWFIISGLRAVHAIWHNQFSIHWILRPLDPSSPLKRYRKSSRVTWVTLFVVINYIIVSYE